MASASAPSSSVSAAAAKGPASRQSADSSRIRLTEMTSATRTAAPGARARAASSAPKVSAAAARDAALSVKRPNQAASKAPRSDVGRRSPPKRRAVSTSPELQRSRSSGWPSAVTLMAAKPSSGATRATASMAPAKTSRAASHAASPA